MRGLLVLTVAMGVLILLGATVLVAVIIHRATESQPPARIAVTLDEPPGTRIAGIAATADRLAVSLQGGGPDRVLLLDPRNGANLGQIGLAK